MGKGKGGKSKGFISQGKHSNVSVGTKAAVRSAYKASGQRLLNQLDASRKGKRTKIVMENPNKEETNRQFISVEGKQWFKPEFAPEKKKNNALASEYDIA